VMYVAAQEEWRPMKTLPAKKQLTRSKFVWWVF
jgi:hypothetical protein